MTPCLGSLYPKALTSFVPKRTKFRRPATTPIAPVVGGEYAYKPDFYPTMESVHLISLGCPKNTADSELMLGALVRAGFEVTMDPQQAQVLLVNTCAFIEGAKKE